MTTPNTNPIYTKQCNASPPIKVTAANTKSDGSGTIGTDIFLLATPGVNDSFFQMLSIIAQATAVGTVTAQTAVRVYLSTKSSGVTTDADTHLWFEFTLPGGVSADNATLGQNPIVIPVGKRIPATWTIGGSPQSVFVLVSLGTAAAANTAWIMTPSIGDY